MGDPNPVGECRVDTVRYRPGASCLASYLLADHNGSRGQETQWYGRCFPREEYISALAFLQTRSWARSMAGAPFLTVPEHCIILFAYPNDRRLHGLQLLRRDDVLKAFLHSQPGDRSIADADVAWSVVRYKPEQRAVVRCSIASQKRDNGPSEGTFYLRLFPDDRGLREYRTMTRLAHCLERQEELRIPNAISFDSVHHALVLGAVPGCKLKTTVSTPGAKDAFHRAGRALAALHGACPAEAPARTLADHGARARRAISGLLRFEPGLATRLKEIDESLVRLVPRGGDGSSGFTHGDIHYGQVLVGPDRIGFVDFERAHNGPVLFDVGNWLAAGRCHRIEGKWADDGTLAQCFLEAYMKARHVRLCAKAVAWWTALALLQMAIKPLRRLDKDAPVKVAQCLDQVSDLLKGA